MIKDDDVPPILFANMAVDITWKLSYDSLKKLGSSVLLYTQINDNKKVGMIAEKLLGNIILKKVLIIDEPSIILCSIISLSIFLYKLLKR